MSTEGGKNFEIIEQYGRVLLKNGMYMEINRGSWFNNREKDDVRSWSYDHKFCGKGASYTREELKAIKEILMKMSL